MKTIALILARGGSKGIPKKNIINVAGRPLLSYTIEAAILSGLETWVSTDDGDIADVANAWGAFVIERPDALATDKATSDSALMHFAEKHDFDTLVFIQPTSPLLRSEHISGGLKVMNHYDSVFSGYESHWIPEWKKFNLNGEKYSPLNWSTKHRPRRQDVSSTFVENGAFYITTRDLLLSEGLRYGGNIGCYKMPYSESFQVDDEEDLRIIEALLQRRRL